MAGALIIPSKFTAIDRFSPVLRKMSIASTSFAAKTRSGFDMISIAERKVSTGLNRLSSKLGSLGQLGIAFGGAMIFRHIADKTIELDKNLHSLQAVTGVTNDKFLEFRKEIERVSISQKEFTGATAKAFEIIASEQPILLSNAKGLGKVTEAVMILSKASGDDLSTSASNLTGVMNQFGLGAKSAERVMNALAAGFINGSASISLINEALGKFGATAYDANMSVEASIAAVEILASKSLKGSEAGTALNSAILNLKKAQVGYSSGVFNMSDALHEMNKKLNSATTAMERDEIMMKAFGKTGMVAGSILLQNADKFDVLTEKVTGTNAAIDMAAQNSNTLSERWRELVNSFDTATTSIGSNNVGLSLLKGTMKFLADNMGLVVGSISTLIISFLALKTFLLVAKVATAGYNFVLGVSNFLINGNIMALRRSKVALIAYNVASKVITAATWLWSGAQTVLNFLLTANPIGIVITLIALLAAGIVYLVNKYDSWSEALKDLIPGFEMITRVISVVKNQWARVSEAFSSGGILNGLKAIGQAIFDVLLVPLQYILDLLGKWFGGGAALASEKLMTFRTEYLGHKEDEKVNVDAEKESVSVLREEKNINKTIDLNIKAPEELMPEIEGDSSDVKVELTPTF